jgi:hypothetical protein
VTALLCCTVAVVPRVVHMLYYQDMRGIPELRQAIANMLQGSFMQVIGDGIAVMCVQCLSVPCTCAGECASFRQCAVTCCGSAGHAACRK